MGSKININSEVSRHPGLYIKSLAQKKKTNQVNTYVVKMKLKREYLLTVSTTVLVATIRFCSYFIYLPKIFELRYNIH